jgi:hypothetical protein
MRIRMALIVRLGASRGKAGEGDAYRDRIPSWATRCRGLAPGAIAGLPSDARISARDPNARRSPMAGVVLAALMMLGGTGIRLINVGQVGVEHFLGKVKPDVHEQSAHVINPLPTQGGMPLLIDPRNR